MKVIHVQTQLNTVFVEVDEDGNNVKEYPVQSVIKVLSEEQFADTFRQLKDVRDKLRADLAAAPAAEKV